ncbi:MAG: Nif11-like leader peptide family natural product precursor [Planctomycetota bacterium]
MAKKDIDRLSADVKKDAKLAEDMKKCGTNAASIVKLAKEKGYNFTEGELKSYAKSKKGQLSEEQLKRVAGGAALAAVHVGVVA